MKATSTYLMFTEGTKMDIPVIVLLEEIAAVDGQRDDGVILLKGGGEVALSGHGLLHAVVRTWRGFLDEG